MEDGNGDRSILHGQLHSHNRLKEIVIYGVLMFAVFAGLPGTVNHKISFCVNLLLGRGCSG